MRKHISKFDEFFERYIQRIPKPYHGIMTFASFAGQPLVCFIIIGCFGVWGWHTGTMSLVAACAIGFAGILINSLLKLSFGRVRPKTAYVENMLFDTFSFPSGHTSSSTIAYGLLIIVSGFIFSIHWMVLCAILLIAFIALVGISRVYLGAHYPSDVLGGWIIGISTLCLVAIFIGPLK